MFDPQIATTGRLGVLMPTLNCKALLPRQVAAMSGWLDLVDEIVVVDSGSTDGTPEWLKANIRHPRMKIVDMPRGLYQAWNAGLGLMTTERVLIATAGDAMEREGIVHLLEVAEKFDADIVLSPPKFVTEDGTSYVREAWPIHQLLDGSGRKEPFVLGGSELLDWTFDAGGTLCGVLGSSASNLYRTRILQRHPFPLDCGSVGDVAWGLRYMSQVDRVVITPQVCAQFVCHPKTEAVVPLLRQPMLEAAVAGVGLNSTQVHTHLPGLRGEMAAVEKHRAALRDLRRRMGGARNFSPAFWRHRMLRNRHRARLRAMWPLLDDVHVPSAWPAHFVLFMRQFLKYA